MDCVYQCPGLAIFGYNLKKDWLFLPIEYHVEEKSECFLVDNNGKKLGEGIVEKVLKKPNKTNIARVKSLDLHGENLVNVRGFIVKENYPEPIVLKDHHQEITEPTYVCHCDDVTLAEILETIGDRKFISVDEVKHTTRLGMGACRGKRCIKRLKQTLSGTGISIVGEPTPRGPLANQVAMGELYPRNTHENVITGWNGNHTQKKKVKSLVAGGGIDLAVNGAGMDWRVWKFESRRPRVIAALGELFHRRLQNIGGFSRARPGSPQQRRQQQGRLAKAPEAQAAGRTIFRRHISIDHGHHHAHNDLFKLELGNAKLELSVFEEGVPPVFRMRAPDDTRLPDAQDVTLETVRADGARQVFQFAAKKDFLESTVAVAEPHIFDAIVRVGRDGQSRVCRVEFREEEHHHHQHDKDDGSKEFQDAHELAHAQDIAQRFAGRVVTTPQIILFGVTGGLMPCPAAFTVLLVCLQLKKLTLGFAVVGAFSFGLALTMVTMGVLAAWSMRHAEKRFKGFGEVMRRAPYVSCVLLVALAGFMAWHGWRGLHP